MAQDGNMQKVGFGSIRMSYEDREAAKMSIISLEKEVAKLKEAILVPRLPAIDLEDTTMVFVPQEAIPFEIISDNEDKIIDHIATSNSELLSESWLLIGTRLNGDVGMFRTTMVDYAFDHLPNEYIQEFMDAYTFGEDIHDVIEAGIVNKICLAITGDIFDEKLQRFSTLEDYVERRLFQKWELFKTYSDDRVYIIEMLNFAIDEDFNGADEAQAWNGHFHINDWAFNQSFTDHGAFTSSGKDNTVHLASFIKSVSEELEYVEDELTAIDNRCEFNPAFVTMERYSNLLNRFNILESSMELVRRTRQG